MATGLVVSELKCSEINWSEGPKPMKCEKIIQQLSKIVLLSICTFCMVFWGSYSPHSGTGLLVDAVINKPSMRGPAQALLLAPKDQHAINSVPLITSQCDVQYYILMRVKVTNLWPRVQIYTTVAQSNGMKFVFLKCTNEKMSVLDRLKDLSAAVLWSQDEARATSTTMRR